MVRFSRANKKITNKNGKHKNIHYIGFDRRTFLRRSALFLNFIFPMKNIIKKLLLRIIHLAGAILLLAILYSLNFLVDLFIFCANLIEKLCIKFGFLECGEVKELDTSFEQKYSEDEILLMAKRTPNTVRTIQEVAAHFDVSYRQARKIQSAIKELDNAPNIRQQYAV